MLNVLQYSYPGMKLTFLGPTMNAVTTRVPNAVNDLWQEKMEVTATYMDPPERINAIFIPGGMGARAPPKEMLDFLQKVDVDNLEYIMTVCTGSAILAMTGLLDGKKATSNSESRSSDEERQQGQLADVPHLKQRSRLNGSRRRDRTSSGSGRLGGSRTASFGLPRASPLAST